jgi:hypothetical protein
MEKINGDANILAAKESVKKDIDKCTYIHIYLYIHLCIYTYT